MVNYLQEPDFNIIVDNNRELVLRSNVLHGLSSLSLSFDTNEDSSNFFERFFRISYNWGVEYFERQDISQLSSSMPGDIRFVVIELIFVKSGDPTFNSFMVTDSSFLPLPTLPILEKSVFSKYDIEYSKLITYAGFLIRKYISKAIMPKFILDAVTSDLLDFIQSVCIFYSLLKLQSDKLLGVKQERDIVIKYLESWNNFLCRDESIELLNRIKGSQFDEFRKRGTSIPFQKNIENNGVGNGEVLRLVCYDDCDDFSYGITNECWSLENTSPLYQGKTNYRVLNRFPNFIEGNIQNIRRERGSTGFIDLSNYSTAGANNVIDGDGNLVISSVPNGQTSGLDYDGNVDKLIPINPFWSYEITFKIIQRQPGKYLSFGVSSFDCENNPTTLNLLNPSFNNAEEDLFLQQYSFPKSNIEYFCRFIIYGYQRAIEDIQEIPDIGVGTNARFPTDASKIALRLFVDNSIGVTNDVSISDLTLNSIMPNFNSSGFIQSKNFFNIWLYNRNRRYGKVEIESILKQYFLTYNTELFLEYEDEITAKEKSEIEIPTRKSGVRLLETGDVRLTESSTFRLLEDN